MLLFAIFPLLLSLVFAINPSTKACSNELAEIVYSPENFYKDYLTKISKELADLAEYFDTPQGPDYVTKFSVKYQVIVNVIDAFGNMEIFFMGQELPIPNVDRDDIFSSRDARAVMNLGAFNNAGVAYVYSFLSFSRDGKVYQITIAKPNI